MGTNNLERYGINSDVWTAFRLRIKGEVLLAGDAGYDAAREIHNASVDKKPALIVKVRDGSDVSRCIHFARQTGLPLAVRAGGHSLAGHSIIEDGLVVDMTEMNEIRIDPDAKTAWAQPGATAGEYTNEAQKYGLATPFGDAASVGLGGITLGGGIGFLVRNHGLAIDNLLGVELVTAEGQILQASETENPDLFWALRGGGGNFGVVTGFQYRLVEVGTIYGGLLVLPGTKEVIEGYLKLSHEAPKELTDDHLSDPEGPASTVYPGVSRRPGRPGAVHGLQRRPCRRRRGARAVPGPCRAGLRPALGHSVRRDLRVHA